MRARTVATILAANVVTAAVCATLAETGHETTGVEATVMAAVGLAAIAVTGVAALAERRLQR